METTFAQRYLFDSRKYTIKENGLQLFSSSLANSAQVFVKFEQVGFTKSFFKRTNKLWLAFMVVTGFYALVMIPQWKKFIEAGNLNHVFVMTGLFIFAAIGYLSSNVKRYILSNYENTTKIDFLTDPDTDLALQDFLVKTKTARDEYLLKNYGQINKSLPYNVMYGQFLWLKNNGVYSNEMYQLKMQELDHTLLTPSKVVGFGHKDISEN